MNVELLNKVKDHILAKPERFAMARWHMNWPPGTIVHISNIEGKKRKMPDCGTIACIAGWACELGDPKNIVTGTYLERAEALLGLDFEESRELFWTDGWSRYFRKLWEHTRSTRKHAEIAGRVIDRFITKHAKG